MITTADVYFEFNEQVVRSRAWLRDVVDGACGYSADALVDRLTQRTVEIAAAPYARSAIERMEHGGSFTPRAGTRIDCNSATITVGSGAITVSAGQFARGLLGFVVYWAYALLSIVTGAARWNTVPAATLVADLTEEDIFKSGRDDRFVEFCRSGPIAPLREASTLFIGSAATGTSCDPDVFRYCRHPLLAAVRQGSLGYAGRLLLLLRHLWLFFEFHGALFRAPVLALIGREFALGTASRELDRRGLIEAVVVTCSSVGSQPLWMRAMRHAQVHMIWYAQNARPVGYITDSRSSDWPPLRWLSVDRHWVWTKPFAQYLQEVVERDVATEVVGPVLWSLPVTPSRSDGAIRILVFDVPAVTDKVMHEIVGEVSNYYHPDNLRTFVNDILVLKEQVQPMFARKVTVTLKMKRGMRPHYAHEYFQHVDGLVARGLLDLASAGDNLFELIGSSDLVIAYPFTSPAYVAEHLGVPCVFYDSTQTVARGDFVDSYSAVRFARGFDELASTAVELLATRRANKTKIQSHVSKDAV